MVSVLSRGVGFLVKSLAGLSCTPAARCSSLPSALSAMQCTTARWFSKNRTLDDFSSARPPKEPPKRPLSSFMRFASEQRPLQIKKHPGASTVEIVKLIGSEWRGLSEAERQVYIDTARVDLLKYRDIFKQYKESLNPLDLEILKERKQQKMQRRKLLRIKRDLKLLGKPKRCRNAFNIFMSEHYQEAKGDSLSAKFKYLVHEWKSLPNPKKQVYMQLAEDDKVRYENEQKAWEEQMIEIGREDLVQYRKKTPILEKTSSDGVKEPGKRDKSKTTVPAKGRKRGPKKHEE